MRWQTVLVGNCRATVHGNDRVMYLGFGHRNRLHHAEKCHRAGHIREQIQVKARTTDRTHDAAHLQLLMPFLAQGLGQIFKSALVSDAPSTLSVQIHQLRNHHHHAVTIAQIFNKPGWFSKLNNSSVFSSTAARCTASCCSTMRANHPRYRAPLWNDKRTLNLVRKFEAENTPESYLGESGNTPTPAWPGFRCNGARC